MEKHPIESLMGTSMESIREMVDVNTVVGDPVQTQDGSTIIPISKIAVGIASGGVDYNDKAERPRPQNFGGGGGTGLSVTPAGFLVIDKNGDVDFINVGMKGKPDPVDQIADLVERTPDIIAKIKDIFAKDTPSEN